MTLSNIIDLRLDSLEFVDYSGDILAATILTITISFSFKFCKLCILNLHLYILILLVFCKELVQELFREMIYCLVKFDHIFLVSIEARGEHLLGEVAILRNRLPSLFEVGCETN